MVRSGVTLNEVHLLFRIVPGSDRYEIHLHMERPPVVRDLMEELEKKARVTLINQQILFRGTTFDRAESTRSISFLSL